MSHDYPPVASELFHSLEARNKSAQAAYCITRLRPPSKGFISIDGATQRQARSKDTGSFQGAFDIGCIPSVFATFASTRFAPVSIANIKQRRTTTINFWGLCAMQGLRLVHSKLPIVWRYGRENTNTRLFVKLVL